jgi:uncharacterized metal-binding protein YceD (DUF177 family)
MARAEHISRRPWSVPVAVSEVPAMGRHFDLLPDELTRAAVARLAGLVALPRLRARFEVSPHGSGGLHVVGRVSATVGQTCVVTLEPIENDIDEPIDLVFLPAGSPSLIGQSGAGIDVLAEDEPEVLVGGTVDLGAIATEFLVLSLDPYPRKSNAVFQAPAAVSDESDHAFAALAELKKRQGGKQK